jgi:hypothetical protein
MGASIGMGLGASSKLIKYGLKRVADATKMRNLQ